MWRALALLPLAACIPSVDECRIAASNTQGIIHLGPVALADRPTAEFAKEHDFYHVFFSRHPEMGINPRDEFNADLFAEESVVYRGISPCPAARHLKRCGITDRAEVLGVRNSCGGF